MTAAVALRELVTFSSGGTPSKSIPEYYSGDIPWITGADIHDGLISPRASITPAAITKSAANKIPAGTVLLVTRTSVGKTAIAPFPLTFSQDITALRPNPDVLDSQYLLHFLRTSATQLVDRARGATIKGVTREDVASLKVPVPSLDEQGRIAEILDQANMLLVERRKAMSLLDDLARSIFHDMFMATGGNRATWPLRNISDLCTLVVDCINRTASTVDVPTPYKMIRTTNVRDGRVDLANVRYVNSETFARWNKRATPIPGDVILTREAPVGEAGILRSNEKVFLGQRLMLYRVDDNLLTPEYLLAAFRSDFLARQFEKFGSGSTVKHLPLPACRNFEIPLPPIALQKRYEDCMRDLNAFRDSQKASLRHLNELLNSLQEKAFREGL